MIEMFNKLLKDVLRKLFEVIELNQALNKVTRSVNFKIIEYLKMSSIEIVIDSIQKITFISFILLTLSERNINDWVSELC